MKRLIYLLSIVCPFVTFAQLPCNTMLGYYQTSWGTYVSLGNVDTDYTVISLAFLEAGGGDGAPDNNSLSSLSFYASSDALLKQDIPKAQAKGKKVLVSIGGGNGSFKLNSDADITTFVNKVKQVIQAYGVDGIDIDLERPTYLSQTAGGTITNPEPHISRMITAIQQLLAWYKTSYNKKMILTLVPEVAYTTGGLSDYMSKTYGVSYLPMIEALKEDIDMVIVQLYNASGGNYGLDGKIYNHGTVDFIVSQTEAMIKGFTCKNNKGVYSGLPASKVGVCLPASSVSASGGYVSPANVKLAVDYLMGKGSKPGNYTLQKSGGYPDLKGLATWSINNDLDGGYAFANNYSNIFAACSGVGTEDEISMSSWDMYPNPASTLLHLRQLNTVEIDSKEVKIYNAAGVLVLEQTVPNNDTVISINQLEKGMYYVKMGSYGKPLLVE